MAGAFPMTVGAENMAGGENKESDHIDFAG